MLMSVRHKPRGSAPTFFCVAVLVLVGASAVRAQSSCAPPHLITWPETNPVWKLCWVSPPDSYGPNASGLELHSVYYKGRLVLNRANVPLLSVKYDRGGCGGPHLTYRDWMGDLQAFNANNVLQPGYAEPTAPPATVCDHPGHDSGSFKGVAAEKRPDRLILTTQIKSAWYRYIQTWTFFPDGTIEPRIGFSAVDYFCTSNPHTHHAFWRFDFDIDDPHNDVIEEYNAGKWTKLDEAQRLKDAAAGRKWRVRDTASNRAFDLLPGVGDTVADDFAVADVWALEYNSNELDDGGATKGPAGDRPHLDRYLDGKNIAAGRQNVVLWYHGGIHHNGDKNVCGTVGPTLKWVPSRR